MPEITERSVIYSRPAQPSREGPAQTSKAGATRIKTKLYLAPRLAVLALLALAILAGGCDRVSWKLNNATVAAQPPPPDSILFPPDSAALAAVAARVAAAAESAALVRFSPFVVTNAHALGRLRRRLGEAVLATALKVSRFDLDHVRAGDTILVPDRPESLLALSPFPPELRVGR